MAYTERKSELTININCGCGQFTAQESHHTIQKVYAALRDAVKHAEQTGHTLEIRGEVHGINAELRRQKAMLP